jgi:hypothetical protein
MNADELRRYADDLVAEWPPLTDAQRARLAVLLHTPTATPAKLRPSTKSNRKAA